MDSWYQPSRARYSPAVRGIPVQQCHRKPTHTSSPKIISIPVHFVGSETARSESALKIQKVFRGFLVRKSVKRIMAIKSQVEEIERSLSKKETAELIRKDTKERLRVNETLMTLLFKLDSIRGVSPGIRDCRKAVIKKAVSLQEKVDFLGASHLDQTTLVVSPDHRDEEAVDAENSNSAAAAAESVDQAQEMKETADEVEDETEHEVEKVAVDSVAENCDDEMMDIHEAGVHYESDVNADEDEDEEEPCVVKEVTECVEEEEEEEEGGKDVEADNENKEEGINKQVLEKMVSENEKMMRMMSQLCETNELQTRMLASLTQRVERLEKAFICDKLTKKKKKNNTNNHTPAA